MKNFALFFALRQSAYEVQQLRVSDSLSLLQHAHSERSKAAAHASSTLQPALVGLGDCAFFVSDRPKRLVAHYGVESAFLLP